MEQMFQSRNTPSQSVLCHQIQSTAKRGGYRAIIIPPSTEAMAEIYGIYHDIPCPDICVHLQTTLPYLGFVNEKDVKPKNLLTLSLSDYILFLEFLVNVWPQAKLKLETLTSKNNQLYNEFPILQNLSAYGIHDQTFSCQIKPDLMFQAWSESNANATPETLNFSFHCRLKQNETSLYIDYGLVSEIVADSKIPIFLSKHLLNVFSK